MKSLQEKVSHSRMLAIILFLAGLGLFFPPAALAKQSISTLKEQVQQMEEDLRILRRELTQVREDVKEPHGR